MEIKSKDKIFMVESDIIYSYKDFSENINKVKEILKKEKNNLSIDSFLLFQYSSWFSFSVFYLAAKELNITIEPTQDELINSKSIKLNNGFQKISYIKKEYNNFCSNFDSGLIISSSGTTGNPKKIYLSYLRLIKSSISIQKYMNTKNDDFHAWSMPPDYVYGLSMLNQVLNTESSVFIINMSNSIKVIMENLKKFNINKLYGVPSGIKMLIKYGNDILPDSIKLVFVAGGRCNKNLAELVIQKKINLCVMYGCTEASARLTYVFDDLEAIAKGCVGRPIEGVDIRIMDSKEHNKISNKENSLGDIVFKSEFSFLGSFENNVVHIHDSSKWIHTGDIGYINNGKLFITGRKARFAKIGGIKISLDEIELFLNEIFKNNELVCIRKDNLNDTDQVCCFISSNMNSEELKSKFIEFCLNDNSYPKWRVAVKFCALDRIPKSKNGKPNYKQLERLVK